MIRVLNADDQELVRAGLRMILDAQPDIEAVADVADAGAAVREAMRLRPDVAQLDIQMPGGYWPEWRVSRQDATLSRCSGPPSHARRQGRRA